MSRRRSSPGFTLVEALVAITMIGILLPIAMYCINLSQTAANLAKQRSRATEIAYNEMNNAIALNTWQADQSGDETNDIPAYHWTTHVQSWANETTLHELHVDVSWQSGNKTRTVSVVTLVYDGGNAQ